MNKVIVTVEGSQREAEGEENKIKMVADGQHYCRNGKDYILYEDNELSVDSKTSTLLKIGKDSLTLLRHGAVEQEQYFSAGKDDESIYRTPYGTLNVSIKTKKIDINYESPFGTIDIEYALSINGKWQSDNGLHISVCEAQTETNKLD
jgi:uncharacterized beta-barrel protein YwiB (DUF1934 family)